MLNELEALARECLEKEPLDEGDISIHGGTSWARSQRHYIMAANPEAILRLIELLKEMAEVLGSADAVSWSANVNIIGLEEALAKYRSLSNGS